MNLVFPRDLALENSDALVLVDLQNDFFPGGSLEVPDSDQIIPVVNRYIDVCQKKGLPIYATRDWHPKNHCSFREQEGPWPVHCVAGTKGAQFHPDIRLPEAAVVISTASTPGKEAYSGFEGTDLHERLQSAGIRRLLIGGLATDYCVISTVRDAIKHGYKVLFLMDATRAVNVNPDDGKKALDEMIALDAVPVEFESFA